MFDFFRVFLIVKLFRFVLLKLDSELSRWFIGVWVLLMMMDVWVLGCVGMGIFRIVGMDDGVGLLFSLGLFELVL